MDTGCSTTNGWDDLDWVRRPASPAHAAKDGIKEIGKAHFLKNISQVIHIDPRTT